jgi:hypothetical protein
MYGPHVSGSDAAYIPIRSHSQSKKIKFGQRQHPSPAMDVILVATAMEFEQTTAATALDAAPTPMKIASLWAHCHQWVRNKGQDAKRRC